MNYLPVWAALIVIALNLRLPQTSFPPVLAHVTEAWQLSAVQVGLVTSIPLMMFAFVAPYSGKLARWSINGGLVLAMALLAAGAALRLVNVSGLMLGTLLVGAGFALSNVLIAGLVKRDLPQHMAAATGCYALVMGVSAGIASYSTEALAASSALGFRLPGLIPVVLALMGLLAVALLLLRKTPAPAIVVADNAVKLPVWRYPSAWLVAGSLAMNSWLYMTMVAWLPELARFLGADAHQASQWHGLMQLSSAFPGIVLMFLLRGKVDLRGFLLAFGGLQLMAMLGFKCWPAAGVGWVLLFGVGTGGALIVILNLYVQRAQTATGAVSLASLAQTVGYLISSSGPLMIGFAREQGVSWDQLLYVFIAMAVLLTVIGYNACHPRTRVPL